MEEALFKVPHAHLVNFLFGFRDRPVQICHLQMRTLTPWKDDMYWDEHTWGHILTSPHIHYSSLHLLPFKQITEVVSAELVSATCQQGKNLGASLLSE